MYYFVHVPKTGGMWLRQFSKINPQLNIQISPFHSARLNLAPNPALFCLRHPVDRFLSALRMRWEGGAITQLDEQIDKFFSDPHREMTALFQPMTRYIGDWETFKQHEHRIDAVFDFDSYPHCVYKHFPDSNRSIENTSINDTKHTANYGITRNNLQECYIKQICAFYAEDFALYEYIQQQPYYIKGE